MIRVAVVGCGDISVVHFAGIAAHPGARLVAVCDVDPDRAAAASAQWGVPAVADHRQLLEEFHPDVVHVCTPHHQHADVAIACLQAGVAVLQEKPLAHTLEQAERIVAAARQHPETKIGVCFQNRYNLTAQAIRRLVDSGRLGAIAGTASTVLWHRTAAYYQARPWRGRRADSGGGVLINQAIHTLDLVQWLAGEVTGVAGRAGTYGLGGVVDVEDTAQLVLDHAGGARSVFFATLAHVVDAPVTLDLIGEHATARLRGDLTVSWSDGRTELVSERTATQTGRAYWGVSHELLINDFYARLTDPDPFWIGPAEALKSLRIITDLYALSAG